jgi:hypothetical protein
MDEGGGGRGWEKLTPEERSRLRLGARPAGTWGSEPLDDSGGERDGEDDQR